MASDPKIRFDILANAQGTQDVEALARELEKLDESLDPALAARARATAAELRVLGQQRSAIEQFVALKSRSQEAAQSLAQAQAAAQALGRSIAAAGGPTRTQAGQMEKLRDAVRGAKAEQEASVKALQAQRQALAAAGVDTHKLVVHQQELERQQAALRGAAASIGAAYQRNAAAAAASADSQARSHRRISEGVSSISDQLAKLQQVASVALGGQLLGGLAGDLAQTADAYSNLAARIRIVTGEGAAFDQAFEGVFDVATRTNTSLEQTGTLFTRIVEAGRQIGVTNQQALALTETINQAVQLSGGSADSAQAAITQLIQGLQSGVLRGEEFNSVMEQAPRLAQALAAGLGVTTGELRNMAQQGVLTSQVVIEALQGQAQAVQTEFAKLPPTVGRAIQNLSSEWTRYVGEVDKANGISAKAADAINAIARNLDTLGALLAAAGKAWAAYKALQLAQTFLAKASAIRTATAALAADTAATVANTAAKQANAAASAQAAGGVAGIGNAATVAGGRMAGLLAGLARLGAVGAGAAAVVSVVSLLGDGIKAAREGLVDLFETLDGTKQRAQDREAAERGAADAARATAQANAELAQKMRLAEEAALGLNEVSRKMVADFAELRQKGEETGVAIGKLAQAMNLGDLKGIADAGAALDALQQKGELTAEGVRQAWARALDGRDLGIFAAQAQAAFDGSAQRAERLKAAMDALADESLRRAGSSVQELQTGFNAAATSAINDVDALAQTLQQLGATGADASRLLSGSLDKALDAAKTERAVQAVIERWRELGQQGVVSGEQLSAGLDKAQRKLDSLQPGVNSLTEALHRFGLKSREELQATADEMAADWERIRVSTTVSLADKIRAFEQYREAAVAANGGVEASEIRATAEMLKLQAAAQGTGETITGAMGRGAQAVGRVTSAAQEAADALRKVQAEQAAAAERGRATAGQIGPDNRVTGPSVVGSTREQRLAGQNAVDNTLIFSLIDKLNSRTLTEADRGSVETAMAAWRQNRAVTDDALQRNAGAFSFDYLRDLDAQGRQLQRMLELLGAGGSGLAAKGGRGALGGSNSGSGVRRTVNINIGGKRTAVGVASEDDADNLVAVMRQLESAAGRSST
jgi:tape measure domain-containing protein